MLIEKKIPLEWIIQVEDKAWLVVTIKKVMVKKQITLAKTVSLASRLNKDSEVERGLIMRKLLNFHLK
jgi:hypothetical protein